MQAVVDIRKVIKAEPSQVFAFVSDLDRHLRWIGGLTYVSKHGQLSPGLRYESRNSAFGTVLAGSHEVRQFIPDQVVEIANVTGPFPSTLQYQLRPVKAGTEVSCHFVISSNQSIFNLARPLVESLARTRLEHDLRALKLFVEQSR